MFTWILYAYQRHQEITRMTFDTCHFFDMKNRSDYLNTMVESHFFAYPFHYIYFFYINCQISFHIILAVWLPFYFVFLIPRDWQIHPYSWMSCAWCIFLCNFTQIFVISSFVTWRILLPNLLSRLSSFHHIYIAL